ncbi:MAG: hypothetical protein LBQ42_07040 [Synergistaceae bacterium]|jgi:type IV pilus assembly protein PilY1|nr:hypothetical protein [Synergistaceae bacterium]
MNRQIKYGVLCGALAMVFMGALDVEAAVQLRGFTKADYPLTDAVITGVEPNVFFLLDVGSPMTFSPKGIMPLATDGRTAGERGNLLRDSTYGVGARPFMTNGHRARNVATADAAGDVKKGDVYAQDIITGTEQTNINVNAGYSRYGRETDDSNNFIGNPDDYYSPYDDKPYFLTFKDSTAANWNGTGSVPASISALASYLPGGANAGVSVPQHLAEAHLVPNDSRMYMMRLVLWRLTAPENADLFTGINVAMGTSYQETNYGTTTVVADFYKAATTGSTEEQPGYYGADATFKYGKAPSWVLGNGTGNDYTSLGGNYYMSQTVFAGVMRDYYEFNSTTPQWRQVNRAVMKVPFDKFYRLKNDGTSVATEKLLDFRQYINGIEAVSGNAASAVEDPEFTADGQTPLSTSIYGREHHVGKNDSATGVGNKLIQYAPFDGAYGSSHLILGTSTTLEGLPTGQAVGSVLDFFSPRAGTGKSDGLEFGNDTLGFFPVTGSCQSNWLVIFTAGNDESPGAIPAHEAALELYKNSLTMRGRAKNSSNVWEEKTSLIMDSGIRTLVVGFVDPDATDPNSLHIQATLRDIAQYGDPIHNGTDYVPNPSATPYFANDVPGLINNLNAVLKRINSDRMAVGAPMMGEGTNNMENFMLSASYTVKTMDQWRAWLYKYELNAPDPAWEAGFNITEQAKNHDRNLYSIVGGLRKEISTFDAALCSALWGIDIGLHPFRDWLYTYDDGVGALGDSAHSGITVVGVPKAASLLNSDDPEIASRDKALYIHTNRGFLHCIDFESGNEIWGFIPPNILNRIPLMKYGEYGQDNTWYNGDGSTVPRSVPLVLLDGMLTTGDVKFSDNKDHTVLLGAMGWGGNGLYAMDVTKLGPLNRTPQFLWAIENARYAEKETNPIDGVKRWGLASGNIGDYDYSDLGLTIQAAMPVVSWTGEHVTILPGGLGYKKGLDGDTQGKVFYFLDAENGTIRKKIDMASSPADFFANGRPLGMAVTPVTHITPKLSGDITLAGDKTVEFYTADSEGNILYCDTTGPIEDWSLKGIFQMLTYAEAGNAVSPSVSADLPLILPRALIKARHKYQGTESTWLFGGTADLMMPDSDLSGTRKLTNEQQFIFAINLTKAPNNAKLADLNQWTYFNDGLSPSYGSPYDVVNKGVQQTLTSAVEGKGWALRLRPKMNDPDDPRDAEYATTTPYFFNGELYIATFVPRTRLADQSETCPEVGDAKLYIINPLTGKSRLTNKNYILLRNIKVTGINVSKTGRLFLGIQQQLNPNSWNEVDDVDLLNKSLEAGGGVGSGDLPPTGNPVNLPNITPNIPHLHYWRERIW